MTPGDPKEKPVNWSRLRQVYMNLTHRRAPVLNGLVFTGIVVETRNPEEMVANTERLVGLKEDPS